MGVGLEEQRGVVVAGAGQAAAQLAQSLRQGGYAGPITLVGDESALPYERPPLSKDYLGNKRDAAQLLLRRPEFWAERQVFVRLGQAVVAVDRAGSSVTLADGTVLAYAWLVWATGGRPRRLPCPGADLPGVHTIRTIADIDALKADLIQPRTVVVIGGGYIGLEAAAVLRGMGLPVTVLEAQERLLARVTSPVVSRFFLDLHRQHGVDVRLGAAVRRLVGAERVGGVELASSEVLPADLVVMGVGITPNVEALAVAGLPCPNGVAVDAHCRTVDSRILAIGDCALHPSVHAGVPIRLESVQNAIDQAKTAAATILGAPQPYTALPWFWSDQYAVKMQTAGLCLGYDQAVVRGDAAGPSFSVAYLRDGRLVAIDCLSAPKDFMAGKSLVAAQARVDVERLADPKVDLKAARLEA
ncbi:FAD-dependent oxidoreductase [Nitrospirillum sp. BR 11164]|uniref:NAD(P)/FAD-dependent oxidoreductase n=1 Tax=Nitrospirillum sp. BR 11164 TaxID=3104324 RepID=UPI002AFF22D8|nr:FAD-dependent oxidoreductase [Nitrospirillum sp. BR 11164]MEA1652833.1 FAD-dependent oxidoreductase [Nitrospirillum sp. BR 11164]